VRAVQVPGCLPEKRIRYRTFFSPVGGGGGATSCCNGSPMTSLRQEPAISSEGAGGIRTHFTRALTIASLCRSLPEPVEGSTGQCLERRCGQPSGGVFEHIDPFARGEAHQARVVVLVLRTDERAQ